ncbi:MAG TPA: hypothetical protein VI636_21095 [Candidatus Angelobacter sp.]
MNKRFRLLLALLAMLPAGWTAAQTPTPHSAANPAILSSPPMSEEDLSTTRERLFSMLRLSPKLAAVLSRDPSLLSDQEYVNRSNPALAQFLQQHPEIARNPEFYLFADHSRPGLRLEQYVFPESGFHQTTSERMWSNLMPFMVFVVFLIGLLWLLRVLLENRRWAKMLKLQSEVHGKLLDKFGNNQELLTYMNTEAGKRFLEAAPMPAGSELASPAKMSLARILVPLQLGAVLTLVGFGFLFLRSRVEVDSQTPMLVLGTLGLMLGIGFIISAGLAFFLARHLDLLPKKVPQLAAREQM